MDSRTLKVSLALGLSKHPCTLDEGQADSGCGQHWPCVEYLPCPPSSSRLYSSSSNPRSFSGRGPSPIVSSRVLSISIAYEPTPGLSLRITGPSLFLLPNVQCINLIALGKWPFGLVLWWLNGWIPGPSRFHWLLV